MLIIQVALGIVLAVVILMFLPQILALGIWAGIGALGLVAVGVLIYFGIEYTVETVVVAFIIGGIISIINDHG